MTPFWIRARMAGLMNVLPMSSLRKLVAVAALLLVAGGAAWGQDFAAAGRHFAAAQDAFGRGEYGKAAVEYQAAYKITGDPSLLFNIGESYERAGQRAQAVQSYKAYLQAQPTAPDRAEVEKRLNLLQEGGAPPSAGGSTSLQREVNPPPQGGIPPSEGGSTSLQREVGPASGAVSPGPADGKPGRMRFAAWTTIATGVALLTAGGVLGLGAQNRADELNRRASLLVGGQPPIYNETEQEIYEGLLSEGRAYNTAAITCYALAGAAAVTGGVLFLLDWRKGQEMKAKQKGASIAPAAPIAPIRRDQGLVWRF